MQCKANYRPISLLASLSKIFERIVYIRLYDFLIRINFPVNPLQSGFRSGDSTVNQLTYIVHKLYGALEIMRKLEWFSWISVRLSTEFGTRIFF